MDRTRSICVTLLALAALPCSAADGPFQLDESKLPEWVRRQGDFPFKAIRKTSDNNVLAQATAHQIAIATIVDDKGQAVIVRGSTRLALAQGVRLRGEDIVETGADTRLLRLEMSDGDFLDLGPSTRLMLAPALPPERSVRQARAYLLGGWVKWTVAQAPATGALLTSSVDVEAAMRVTVLARLDDTTFAFAETGDATLLDHRGGHASTPRILKSQNFFAQLPGGADLVTGKPAPDFVARLPAALLDSLPARAPLFAREVQPRALGEIDYAQAQPWLDAEPALRRLLVPRWQARAEVPAFRKPLLAGLAAHPEWEHVLFPDKSAARRTTMVSSNPTAPKTP